MVKKKSNGKMFYVGQASQAQCRLIVYTLFTAYFDYFDLALLKIPLIFYWLTSV